MELTKTGGGGLLLLLVLLPVVVSQETMLENAVGVDDCEITLIQLGKEAKELLDETKLLRHSMAVCDTCRPADPCKVKPCFPTVQCNPNTRHPYFKCQGCPLGYTGNGQNCSEKPKCGPGTAGDGIQCGRDGDGDGFPDEELRCREPECRADNCQEQPNPSQLDNDGDGVGDACESNADGDLHSDENDNCPTVINGDQLDSDADGFGDACDNCPHNININQLDSDGDGQGDACDDDLDGDGVDNYKDNCPGRVNRRQRDTEQDGVGDECDNCPERPNPGQEDTDRDGIGDVCDTDDDQDGDGIQDDVDNCPGVPNANQHNADGDRNGDACDDDADGDGVPNEKDNCRLVANADQRYRPCRDDQDGDKIKDSLDACVNDSSVSTADFREFESIVLDEEDDEDEPEWHVNAEGTEIYQTANSKPALAVGKDRFEGIDFMGTFYVDTIHDNDYIGFVFGFQDVTHFYALMWKRAHQTFWHEAPTAGVAEQGLSLKVVKASSLELGIAFANALWHTGDTGDQVKLLWKDPSQFYWSRKTSYRWHLVHRPKIGLIRFKLYKGSTLKVDSGNLYDTTLKGGRLGVFCFSQSWVHWRDMTYRCEEEWST